MITVAALYVDPKGPYFKMPGVECWDEKRDARLYAGPHPVVAHPPCTLWINFAALNYKRWGSEHNRPGNDGGCFEAALRAVQTFGGVLEHPAGSKAWGAFSLHKPMGNWWTRFNKDWICEVWQSAYGHKARKATWLLYRGKTSPLEANWRREPGTHQVGHGWNPTKPVLKKSEVHLTPQPFAEYLVALARHSVGNS